MSGAGRNAAIVDRVSSGMSMKAVAAEFGLTPERIRQILIRATNGERECRPASVPWPEEREQRLRVLWDEGLSITTIGRRLGVSRNAVTGKARRLDLPARPSPIRR
jgi:GcrA cell cycle regulator